MSSAIYHKHHSDGLITAHIAVDIKHISSKKTEKQKQRIQDHLSEMQDRMHEREKWS